MSCAFIKETPLIIEMNSNKTPKLCEKKVLFNVTRENEGANRACRLMKFVREN